MRRTARGIIYAEIETTYGTDPTPNSSSNVLYTAGPATFEADYDNLDRTLIDQQTGMVLGSNVRPRCRLSWESEIRGNRTDGTAPDISAGSNSYPLDIHPLLLACDLAATYTAESGAGARDGYVTYNPTIPASVGDSVTLWFYDGVALHKLNGGKGNLRVRLQAGQFGKLAWSFSGLFGGITDASFPAQVAESGFAKPPTLGAASSLSYGGYSSGVLTTLNFDLGNRIIERLDANSSNAMKGFAITGYEAAGDLDFEAVSEATNPFWADLASAGLKTLIATLGSATGNRFTLTSTVVPRNIRYGDRNGLRTQQLQFAARRADFGVLASVPIALKFS